MQKRFLFLFSVWLVLASCANNAGQNAGAGEAINAATGKSAKSISGKVIGISDGDTFRLLAEGNETVRVRLYGIDAPEKGQDYATQSQQKLSSLIFSKQVRVQQKNKDRYGRVVGVAFADDININEEMLRSGLAWHYRQYDKNDEWARLQSEAQRKRVGLWNKPSPTPPWEWRKDKREQRQGQMQ